MHCRTPTPKWTARLIRTCWSFSFGALGAILLIPSGVTLAGEPGPAQTARTAEQQERLDRRDRLDEQSAKALVEGHWAKALEAAQGAYALEQRVFGRRHAELLESMRDLAACGTRRPTCSPSRSEPSKPPGLGGADKTRAARYAAFSGWRDLA